MTEIVHNLFRSFPFAVGAGLVVGVTCALLGVFVILKRVVFIGVALSEISACGVGSALLLGWHPLLGALVVTLAAVATLAVPFENRRIPRDALLGVLFVAASSLSILLVSRSGLGLHEIRALLYGDLILTTRSDFLLLVVLLGAATACFLGFMRPMLYSFLDRDAATVLRIHPARWEVLFFVLLGMVVAAASKTAGALLVFCYLVAPPTAALLLSRRLGRVLALAVGLAALMTLVGMALSFAADLPTNQTICATGCGLLLCVLPFAKMKIN